MTFVVRMGFSSHPGAILLLPAETFDPRAAMRSVVDNQATVLYGVPTMFLAYLDIVSEE